MKIYDLTDTSRHGPGGSIHTPIPGAAGRGEILIIPTAPGVEVALADYRLNAPAVFIYRPHNAAVTALGIGFCLEGCSTSHPACLKTPSQVHTGQSYSFSFSETVEFAETVNCSRMLSLDIVMTPGFMDSLAAEYPELIPETLPQIFREPVLGTAPMTLEMKQIIFQMRAFARNTPNRLFLRAKAMELLSLKLDQFRNHGAGLAPNTLNPGDLQQIRRAARRMIHEPDQVKNMADLARSVGMCRSRLHQSFKLVFGMPPSMFLRRQRMETAVSLLSQGRMNVTQTAYAVGFSSLSHFAKTFRRHVGVSPGTYLKSRSCRLKTDPSIKKTNPLAPVT